MCSYLPGTIADKCEEFVDEYGQKVIDAIVHEELKPTEVCSQVFPDCGEARSVECVWGVEMCSERYFVVIWLLRSLG